VDDELRRRQEEVLLTLALMDTSEGTANFTDRLRDEAEKVRHSETRLATGKSKPDITR
jgi:hypothetical protein